MRKWWKKHYCVWCKRRVFFPFLHFVVHALDIYAEELAKDKENAES